MSNGVNTEMFCQIWNSFGYLNVFMFLFFPRFPLEKVDVRSLPRTNQISSAFHDICVFFFPIKYDQTAPTKSL